LEGFFWGAQGPGFGKGLGERKGKGKGKKKERELERIFEGKNGIRIRK
jgi:hypothetical protein